MTIQERLADKLENVQWHNHYFSCNCVFDEHEKPALLVYPDGYWCKSCNKGGEEPRVFGTAGFITHTTTIYNCSQIQNHAQMEVMGKEIW